MTLEEALAENIKLSQANAQLQAELSLSVAKAKDQEQVRILSLLDAGKTFGIANETVVKFAKQGATVELALASFEAIKEATQGASGIDSTDTEQQQVDTLNANKGTKVTTQSAKDFMLNMAEQSSKARESFGGLL